jgi:hypothetical protein
MLIGLVIMICGDIDTRSQLATENATWVWLSLIPAYVLALILLFLFYQKGHTWRKENVVVGFQFTSNVAFEESQNRHQQIIAQTNFRGSWVVTPAQNFHVSRNSNNIPFLKLTMIQDQGSLEGPNPAPLEDPDSIQMEQISTPRSREDQPGRRMKATYLICDFIIFLLHIVSFAILATVSLFILFDKLLGKEVFKYVIKWVIIAKVQSEDIENYYLYLLDVLTNKVKDIGN